MINFVLKHVTLTIRRRKNGKKPNLETCKAKILKETW